MILLKLFHIVHFQINNHQSDTQQNKSEENGFNISVKTTKYFTIAKTNKIPSTMPY